MGGVMAGAGWWRVSRGAARCAFRVVRVAWVGKRSQQPLAVYRQQGMVVVQLSKHTT